ncbi:hypothetical protein GHT06_009223 [Daphnia sinensis]|uniref:Uncharacterized protein n=1 Tax=Daphnia sinensis TaxID=1820382 RepID=A0AAD5L2P7_9CRUS|nr:hypothetical protein GHT06_009223 [Daphnia sinensis]
MWSLGQFLSSALQCAKIDDRKNLFILLICIMWLPVSNFEITYLSPHCTTQQSLVAVFQCR